MHRNHLQYDQAFYNFSFYPYRIEKKLRQSETPVESNNQCRVHYTMPNAPVEDIWIFFAHFQVFDSFPLTVFFLWSLVISKSNSSSEKSESVNWPYQPPWDGKSVIEPWAIEVIELTSLQKFS